MTDINSIRDCVKDDLPSECISTSLLAKGEVELDIRIDDAMFHIVNHEQEISGLEERVAQLELARPPHQLPPDITEQMMRDYMLCTAGKFPTLCPKCSNFPVTDDSLDCHVRMATKLIRNFYPHLDDKNRKE